MAFQVGAYLLILAAHSFIHKYLLEALYVCLYCKHTEYSDYQNRQKSLSLGVLPCISGSKVC